jgi:hypothetical protein
VGRPETLPTVDVHAGRGAHSRWRARLPTAAAASVIALCGLHSSSPSAAATNGSQRALGGHGSPVRSKRYWSDPEVLARCGLASGPQVAFPSESPATPTGIGAIVWASELTSCGSRSRRSPRSAHWAISVAAVGPAGGARLVSTQPLGAQSPVELTAVGASFGRIALAAANPTAGSAGGANALLQGRTVDRSRWPSATIGSGARPALTRAYLGDAAIAAIAAGPAIAVRVQRSSEPDFGQPRLVPTGPGRVTALTATMDYRADVLLAWQQNGGIYVRMLRSSGQDDPTQRIGPSGPDPQIQAVVSDNDHGMIAWSSTEVPKRGTARTRIYLDLSAVGVRFGQPLQLASFADPQRVGRSPGSLALERLSTENVMLAWTVAERGHYVVRAAPAVFAASRPTTRLSDPRSQAILADLAPGPAGEAIALWSTAPRFVGGTLDMGRAELWAARTSIRPHAHVVLRAPEKIAAAGPSVAATVAVDPATDRAVAAWLTLTAPEHIEYAVAVGEAGYRPRPPTATMGPAGAGTHWLRITLAAAGLAVAAIMLVTVRRRRPREN